MSDETTLLPCPFCGGEVKLTTYRDEGWEIKCENHDWSHATWEHPRKASDIAADLGMCSWGLGEDAKAALIEAWNTRAAVTDHDFAMAAHDGRTWVCVEDALESDALTPIPGFTRNDIYRDAMSEYGEWMEKATDLMRDMWDAMLDANPNGGVRDMGLIEKRLREFGIEVEDER